MDYDNILVSLLVILYLYVYFIIRRLLEHMTFLGKDPFCFTDGSEPRSDLAEGLLLKL